MPWSRKACAEPTSVTIPPEFGICSGKLGELELHAEVTAKNMAATPARQRRPLPRPGLGMATYPTPIVKVYAPQTL